VTKGLPVLLLLLIIFLQPSMLQAQASQDEDEQEVLLSFRYRGVIANYVLAKFRDGEFYIATSEVLNLLQIENNINLQALSLSGSYADTGLEYEINFGSGIARLGEKSISMNADDYLVRETDFFLHPGIFEELLGLNFTVDFNNLTLSLQTEYSMPVVARQERELRRQRMLRNKSSMLRDYHPLQFDRDRKLLDAGFLDYNFSTSVTERENVFFYNTSTGVEVAGGDFQGTFAGAISADVTSLNTSNVRWRYVLRDNLYMTQATAGQSISNGLQNLAFTGVKLTNEPIEPRFIYDEFLLQGETTPESEVELYLNNSLVDFQRADDFGNYRFQVPLSYGSSQYDVRIFSPTGQVRQEFTRLQIPFNFLPPGEINYTVNAGRLDNPIFGTIDRGFMTQNNVRAGINNWLTAGAGVEYFDEYNSTPTFSGSLSSRLFTKYLFTVEAANGAFVRFNSNAVFPSSSNFSLDYTYFLKDGGLYNPGRNNATINGSIFTPFTLFDSPFFFRWTTNVQQRETSNVTRYNFDLNSRLNRLNLRIGYQDSQIGNLRFESTPLARFTTSATYTLARHSGIPVYLRGAFLRARLEFLPSSSRVEETELQLSRSIMRNGRLQINFGRNFIGDFNLFSMSLTLDFNKVRSTTTTRNIRGDASLTQSVRGSVGFDSDNNRFLLTNRQQVGRSGVAVRLFTDQNENGTFDEGDQLLNEQAARLGRSAGAQFTNNDITYFSQLLAYNRYNLEINKNVLKDPLLVPALESFSLVTDPNRYKQIDIPMYMSGVLEGMVLREVNGNRVGVGGLRIQITGKSAGNNKELYRDEIRTFSDGSFYTFELPPGRYEVEADSTQLDFLGVEARPEKLEFEVEAKADGDIIEGLEILLVNRGNKIRPQKSREEAEKVPADTTISKPEITKMQKPSDVPALPFVKGGFSGYFNRLQDEEGSINQNDCTYTVQIGSYRTHSYSLQVADEAEKISGYQFGIYPNRTYGLNAIRAERSMNLNEAILLKSELEKNLGLIAPAIVNQCYLNNKPAPPKPARYALEIESNENPDDLRLLLSSIEEMTSVKTDTDDGSRQNRFITGFFEMNKDALNFYREISALEEIESVHLRINQSAKQRIEFDYLLQTGMFSTYEEASVSLTYLQESLNLESKIFHDENDTYFVVLTNTPQTWSELNSLYEKLSDTVTNSGKPVIHLIEYSVQSSDS